MKRLIIDKSINFIRFFEYAKEYLEVHNKKIELFNSRNIRRKQIPDTILAYRHFIDTLPIEKAKKCCLVLHTERVNEHGTDLDAVIELLANGEQYNIPEFNI